MSQSSTALNETKVSELATSSTYMISSLSSSARCDDDRDNKENAVTDADAANNSATACRSREYVYDVILLSLYDNSELQLVCTAEILAIELMGRR